MTASVCEVRVLSLGTVLLAYADSVMTLLRQNEPIGDEISCLGGDVVTVDSLGDETKFPQDIIPQHLVSSIHQIRT